MWGGGEAVGCGEVGNYLHVSVLKPFNQCCMASAKQVTKSPNDIAHLIQGLFIFTYWRYESHNYASHARGRETDSSLPKQKLCAHNPESAGPERTNTAKTLATVEHAVPKTKKREKKCPSIARCRSVLNGKLPSEWVGRRFFVQIIRR